MKKISKVVALVALLTSINISNCYALSKEYVTNFSFTDSNISDVAITDEAKLKNSLLSAITSNSEQVKISVNCADAPYLEKLILSTFDNLEITESYQAFKVNYINYSINPDIISNTSEITIKPIYRYNAEQEIELFKTVKEVEESLFDESDSDEDKVEKIHDWMCKNLTYSKSTPSRNAYEAVTLKLSVCQGYAHLTKLMLDMANIPSIMVLSHEMNHSWNRVYLGGRWLNLDTTWDDLDWSWNPFTHSYFCVTDEEFSKHTWDTDKYSIVK